MAKQINKILSQGKTVRKGGTGIPLPQASQAQALLHPVTVGGMDAAVEPTGTLLVRSRAGVSQV
ncbi:hypothetical protein LZP73_04615 [Shewanella sp. AS16]|uniref:hypothetical protein n=1 Tax=Shewanella sp. AS16 TaxID=2907625 RepID=UPI001F3343F1|nr:hypothetical protein [Shewanella sp. AS16]MCE9685501.1 hypothetical protein [Shewanella sp. AS16]